MERCLKAFLAMLRKARIAFRLKKKGRQCLVIIKACAGPFNEGLQGASTVWTFYSGKLESVAVWN